VANQAYKEAEERCAASSAAVNGRLRDIEMRLGQLRGELGEVGRWALYPECPDISRPLKRVREILQDAEREIRQARRTRLLSAVGSQRACLTEAGRRPTLISITPATAGLTQHRPRAPWPGRSCGDLYRGGAWRLGSAMKPRKPRR
jgi:hypothetical protein